MKKIGEGWQYAVYDLGNGRVLKKFHSWPGAYWAILKDIFPFNADSPFKIPSFIMDVKRKADESLEVLKKINIPAEWIANPKFINRYDFEQDKVRPLHEMFENMGTEETKNLIDKFIEFNKKLLDIGVIDKSFSITKNYGMNGAGKIVLTEIGELFAGPEKIRRQIENRAWDKDYIWGNIKDPEARKYFISEMDRNFMNQ